MSQVIGALLACPYRSSVSKLRYFQVAESQVIALLQVVSLASVAQEIGLLPGCGIPGHQCSPLISIGCQPRMGGGLLPGCGIPGHVRSPFIGSLLPGRGLERNRVPGHGRNSFLEGRKR